MKIFKLAAALAAAAALAGCVTIGKPFPTDGIKNIKVGKTTQAEISSSYGPPYRTGVEDGDMTWTYLRYHLSAFGGDSTDDLYVRFNADGTVKSYAFNTNSAAQ